MRVSGQEALGQGAGEWAVKEDNHLRQLDTGCRRQESDPGIPGFSFAAVALKEPEFPILPASHSPGQIPSDKVCCSQLGCDQQGDTEKRLSAVAARPAFMEKCLPLFQTQLLS